MELGRTNGRFELGRDGIVKLHKSIRKLLGKFTLLFPHGVVLGHIKLRVLLVFLFVPKGVFKGSIV